jgi:hypothetical protein
MKVTTFPARPTAMSASISATPKNNSEIREKVRKEPGRHQAESLSDHSPSAALGCRWLWEQARCHWLAGRRALVKRNLKMKDKPQDGSNTTAGCSQCR